MYNFLFTALARISLDAALSPAKKVDQNELRKIAGIGEVGFAVGHRRHLDDPEREAISLTEYDCPNGRSQTLQQTIITAQGGDKTSSRPSAWMYITPDTVTGTTALRKMVGFFDHAALSF